MMNSSLQRGKEKNNSTFIRLVATFLFVGGISGRCLTLRNLQQLLCAQARPSPTEEASCAICVNFKQHLGLGSAGGTGEEEGHSPQREVPRSRACQL